MGLFSFFKKRDADLVQKEAELDRIKAFSLYAVNVAIPEIEQTDTFQPFGGILKEDNTFQKIEYKASDNEIIKNKEQVNTINRIIKELYKEPQAVLFFIAWDGIMHLLTGDVDCISVKVDNRILDIHRIFYYPYTLVNGKVEFTNMENPMIEEF